MRVTSKGQVTIPKRIRMILGIRAGSKVEFVEEDGVVRLKVLETGPDSGGRFRRLRGAATIKLSTEEIMKLTRGEE